MPSGPGFRLRRNHAKGAFPPFGFNPITQGAAADISRAAHPAGESVSRGRSWSPRQAQAEIGLSVRFDGRTDQRRAPGSSARRGSACRPASGLPATPGTPAPAKVRRSLARKHPAGIIRTGLDGQGRKDSSRCDRRSVPDPRRGAGRSPLPYSRDFLKRALHLRPRLARSDRRPASPRSSSRNVRRQLFSAAFGFASRAKKPSPAAFHCGSAWKKDPGSGVIGVEKGPLIPVV